MSYFGDLLALLLNVMQIILALAIGYAKGHPLQVGVAVVALLRLFGTTVQTGSKGVLFVFGRVRKELEPGFHPLFPIVMTVRKIPVRSVTLDLPRQRITTADGLVYDVQANIVYRVADPKLAVTQVDSLNKGIEAVLALIAEDLLRNLTRASMMEFKALDADLIGRAEQKLHRWGVTVEQAGFKSIAPTRKTLRLTQLGALTSERQRMFKAILEQGMSMNAALALLGADRRLVSHAKAHYHALHRKARPAPVPAVVPQPVPLRVGEEPPDVPEHHQEETEPTSEALINELVQPAETGPLQAPTRAKKTTKGVQPRSWLRLQSRLRSRHGGEPHLPGADAKHFP